MKMVGGDNMTMLEVGDPSVAVGGQQPRGETFCAQSRYDHEFVTTNKQPIMNRDRHPEPPLCIYWGDALQS